MNCTLNKKSPARWLHALVPAPAYILLLILLRLPLRAFLPEAYVRPVAVCLAAVCAGLWFLRFERVARPQAAVRGNVFWPAACSALGTALLGLLFFRVASGQPSFTVLSVLETVIAGPLAEELVFRATVLPRAEDVFGRAGALIFSSAVFAAAHGTLLTMAAAFPAGILYGALYLRRYRVRDALAAHAGANLLAFALPYVPAAYRLPLGVFGAVASAGLAAYLLCCKKDV